MNISYYSNMMVKGRLIPLIVKERLMGFITFYITNEEKLYAEADPWEVLEDNPNGKICYIAQLITDKNKDNKKIFFSRWTKFKKFIISNFPSVKTFCWRRWNRKMNILKIYRKDL